MEIAKWVDCPGIVNEGRQNHTYRDSCWSCAPFWERIPLCPSCGTMLRHSTPSGRVMCAVCHKMVQLREDLKAA